MVNLELRVSICFIMQTLVYVFNILAHRLKSDIDIEHICVFCAFSIGSTDVPKSIQHGGDTYIQSDKI